MRRLHGANLNQAELQEADLSELQYRSAESRFAGLEEHIIGPAEEMAKLQTQYRGATAAPKVL